jgi:hypothetical protein
MADNNNVVIMVAAYQTQCNLPKQKPNVQNVAIPVVGGSPASGISFGVVKLAPSLGDCQMIRFHLGKGSRAGLKQLAEQF